MNLTSVKYQDSCIYIGLDGSQGQIYHEKAFKEIKNVYAVYKIKACDNYVRDTILIRNQDIMAERGKVVVKFELNQLHRPEECEIEIVSLKFIYHSGKKEELIVNKSYSFLEIRSYPPIAANKKNSLNKSFIQSNKTNKRVLSVTQEVIVSPPEANKPEEPIVAEISFKEDDQIIQDEITVIEKIIPLSTIVSEVEFKTERKLDAQTKKLEMDIKQLCYETIDLLLTSLPQPEFAEEYHASNAMVQSIHRYINSDLLQKEQEEGENA
jgi:hypothetical protein